MTKSILVSLLLVIALPLRSLAAPHVITSRQLTEGSLLGQITSTQQLQRAFSTHALLLAHAGGKLGLSRHDFAMVRQAIDSGHTMYVTVPQHLDGMAGAHGGVPFVVHDIIIPANVYGWEVDLRRPNGIVRVYIPNTCGNISVLRVPKRYYVAGAYHVPTPAPAFPAAPRLAAQAPRSSPTPVPQAIATTAPVAVAAPPAAATASHHLGWLPFLLVPIIAGLAAGHGSSSSSTGPTPIHTICPTAGIRIRIP
jgi:hypothetical protein